MILVEIELVETFIALQSGLAWPVFTNEQAIAIENPAEITPWAAIQHTELAIGIHGSGHQLGVPPLQGNRALPVAVVALNRNGLCISPLHVGRAGRVIHQEACAA